MEIIQYRSTDIEMFIVNQDVKNTEYKLSKYLMIEHVGDDILIYNLITQEIIVFNERIGFKEELDKYRIFLIEHWFLVPIDFHEKTFCDTLIKIKRNISNPEVDNGFGSLVILPTSRCNASCYYCFENKWKSKFDMTIETADKLIEMIKKNNRSSIDLKWFGGEPLVGKDIITYISKQLIDLNIKFHSSMISNGSLFHIIPKETILDIWKLKKVQITIDGLEDKYNEIKGLDFETTINNVEFLLSIGVIVSIRIMLKKDLPDDVQKLKDVILYIYNRFGKADKNKKLDVYFTNIYESWATEEDPEGLLMYEKMKEVDSYIHQYYPRLKERRVKTTHCMADNGGETLVILPDGSIDICEHNDIGDNYGNIETGFDREKPNPFLEKYIIPECDECTHYPTCNQLVACAGEIECKLGNRKYKDYKTIQTMKYRYDQYINYIKNKRNP